MAKRARGSVRPGQRRPSARRPAAPGTPAPAAPAAPKPAGLSEAEVARAAELEAALADVDGLIAARPNNPYFWEVKGDLLLLRQLGLAEPAGWGRGAVWRFLRK